LSVTTSVLVVEPSPGEAVEIVSALSELGLPVTVSETFTDAKTQLLAQPRLLITELRLGEYNGLHLVVHGTAARTDMAAVVMSRIDDPVLTAESERLGATFVQKDVSAEELRAAVCRTLFRVSPEPIRAPFERRKRERRSDAGPPDEPERRIKERRRDLGELIQRVALS
jgi:DNA-binding NtrC family response regulator